MRVLLTRPKPESEALAKRLGDRGMECRVEPMLDIVPRDPGPLPVDIASVQAILVTSANGAVRLPALTERRDLPVLAVGDATAEAVRALGFTRVESAEGAVEDLAALVKSRLSPVAGPLLHAAGEIVAGDLTGLLEAAGFTIHRVTLYEARPAGAISPGTLAALKRGRLDAVLFFSPRTAETFARLAQSAGLTTPLSRLHAVAISQAVADACRALPWRSVKIAATPTQDGIVAALDTLIPHEQAEGEADATAKPAPPADSPQPKSTDQPMTDASDGKKTGPNNPGSNNSGSNNSGPNKPGPSSGAAKPAAKPDAPKTGAASAASATAAASAKPEAKTPPSSASPSASPSTSTPAQKRPGSARRYGYGLLALVVLAIVAVGTLPLWRPAVQPYLSQLGITLPTLGAAQEDRVSPLAERVAALEQQTQRPAAGSDQIAALEGRIARLEERQTALSEEIGMVRSMLASEGGGSGSGGAVDAGPLSERLDALEAEIKQVSEAAQAGGLEELRGRQRALETALAEMPRADPAELGRLREEIGVLREGVAKAAALDGRREALMLAVAQLATPMQQGAAYETEMAAIARLVGAESGLEEELSVLKNHAAAGVPTIAVLADRFPDIAAAAVRAERAGESQSVVGETLNRIAGLVSLRRTGQVEGETVEARTARAEEALERHDLAAAVSEMAALQGPAAEAVAPWMEDARARLAVNDALARLRSHAVANLSQSAGSPVAGGAKP
ncbi:uroporphyrinogen-III synthase [Oceanibaculum pacificum]|uniref:uroporphyrinogen-III synthase n=1 Tax=Oceanibaculum pacificum TaxID=580166 RepID=UPI000A60200A|nr:uroporphyrinogen-III synthase [Oceanibaculum pacificum]